MSKVDWSKAPDDAEFYAKGSFRKLKDCGDDSLRFSDVGWVESCWAVTEIFDCDDYEDRPEKQVEQESIKNQSSVSICGIAEAMQDDRSVVGEFYGLLPIHDVGQKEDKAQSKISATVNERGNNYGKFKDGADIMQELKQVMRSAPNWRKLTPSQREALEMIQHKIGRILNGNPSYTDSWHDIQGYAKLIEDELSGDIK